MNDIFKDLTHTYRQIILVLLVLLFYACQQQKKQQDIGYDQTKISDSLAVNVLDHPLIFENLNLKIVSFSAVEKEGSHIELRIIVDSSSDQTFSKNHFFYIHAYPYDRLSENQFINLDTDDGTLKNDQLIFKSIYSGEIVDFEIIRFGLVKRTENKRYFTRTLRDKYIKN